MRFTEENWARFDTHNKKTTIRTRELHCGPQPVYAGSYYKPKRLGNGVNVEYRENKKVWELTEEDAHNDGFDSLGELLLELGKLNKKITMDTPVYIYSVKKL